VRRALVALAVFAAFTVPASGANFNNRSTNAATFSTDSTGNYVRLWSQGTDPAGLTGYATKRGSNPLVPAATGADGGLAVAMGGYKNDNGTTVARVLTIQALNPLPAGVTSLTISASLIADPATGRQPLTGFTFSPIAGTPTSATATLTPGQKVQLNLGVKMKNTEFPGNNTLYHPAVNVIVRYTGYSGNFLSYTVPVSVWDGNGAGP
jgi:hypothetical protein